MIVFGVTHVRLSSDPDFPTKFWSEKVPPRRSTRSLSLNSSPLIPVDDLNFPYMSEKETIRAAVQILTQQLTQLTFDAPPLPITNNVYPKRPQIGTFIATFEAILESIISLTHGTFSSSIKKTMLRAQLRGVPARWAWEANEQEVNEMDYKQFKEALKKEFS